MKQQFRHKDGCCVCATKSSTTRFQASAEYEAHFAQVFGVKARHRSGHICNACILCVRRGTGVGTSSGGGSPVHSASGFSKAPYANVVDSRRGTGPKHMKQITKRNRRREIRDAATASSPAVAASTTIAAKATAAGGCGGGAGGPTGKQQQLQIAEAAGGSGCGVGVGLDPDLVSGRDGGLAGHGGAGSGGGGVVHQSCTGAMTGQMGQGEFRTPLAPPSGSASGRRRLQPEYYKKRVIMRPVKLPDSKEIGELFQDVMQSRFISQPDGPLSFQQVHSAFLSTKRRRLVAGGGSETASVTSTEAPESFTSDTPSAGGAGPLL